MENSSKKYLLITALILTIVGVANLGLITWICHMAYQNTCVELEEQYIVSELGDIIDSVENSINFGKTLDNYYGMEEVIDEIESLFPEKLRVLITDAEGIPLYLSFEESDENTKLIASVTEQAYLEKLMEIPEGGGVVTSSVAKTIAMPIYKDTDSICGYALVCYDRNSLESPMDSSIIRILLFISVLMAILIFGFYLMIAKKVKEKAQKAIPMMIIVLVLVSFSITLFQNYRDNYQDFIYTNTRQTAASVVRTINSVLEKGLPVDEIHRLDDYLQEKVEKSESIENLTIDQTDDTADNLLDIGTGEDKLKLKLEIKEDIGYINEKLKVMALSFGAVIVICLMIAYEAMSFAPLILHRFSGDFGKKTKAQTEATASQIRLISFFCFTAIYVSLPYAAVVMRGWEASVFGLSPSVSASLPLTVELLSVLIASAFIQKIFAKTPPAWLMAIFFPIMIVGNLACMKVANPLYLVVLRAICGIGFAFMKYWQNAIVTAGSENEKELSVNVGRLNAGLLGGITAGSSLGAILAQSFGYQFNYFFTSLIFMGVAVWCILSMPWDYYAQIVSANTTEASKATKKNNAWSMITPRMLLTLAFGCLPLNVGLMYVVSFVPSYMDAIGASPVSTSYVYLVNGIAGIYIGIIILNLLKKKSLFFASSLALFMATGGILVLLVSRSVGIVMISAGVMGLFDGFGTPSITSYFTSMTQDRSNIAAVMTFFNMVGSTVQIFCPMLYGLIIRPDGGTLGLFVFGIVYFIVSVLFFVLCRPKDAKKTYSF